MLKIHVNAVGGGHVFVGHVSVGHAFVGQVTVKLQPTDFAQFVSTSIKQDCVAPPLTFSDLRLETVFLLRRNDLRFLFFII